MNSPENQHQHESDSRLSKEKLLSLALIIASGTSAALEKSQDISSEALEQLKTADATVEQLKPEQTKQITGAIDAYARYMDVGGEKTITIDDKQNPRPKEISFIDNNTVLVTEPDEQMILQLVREGKFHEDILTIKKGSISDGEHNGISAEVGVDVKTNLIRYVERYIDQSKERGFNLKLEDGSTVTVAHGSTYDAGYGQEVASGAARIMGELSQKLVEKVSGK